MLNFLNIKLIFRTLHFKFLLWQTDIAATTNRQMKRKSQNTKQTIEETAKVAESKQTRYCIERPAWRYAWYCLICLMLDIVVCSGDIYIEFKIKYSVAMNKSTQSLTERASICLNWIRKISCHVSSGWLCSVDLRNLCGLRKVSSKFS